MTKPTTWILIDIALLVGPLAVIAAIGCGGSTAGTIDEVGSGGTAGTAQQSGDFCTDDSLGTPGADFAGGPP